MTYTEYKEKASRTLSELGSKDKNVLHMIVGMSTEINEILDAWKKHFAYGRELDLVNIKEEIGDFLWYVANFCSITNFENVEFDVQEQWKSEEKPFFHIVEANKIISDILCNHYSYQEPTENYYELLQREVYFAFEEIIIFSKVMGFDIEEIAQTNIKKLEVRYPEKFTQENALNRNLESERKILEN